MFSLHTDAVFDLRAIRKVAPADAQMLAAFIEQLKADPRLVARLHEKNYGEDRKGPIGVKWWNTLSRETGGKPMRRLRAWELEAIGLNYRLLYLYNFRDSTFHLLAVVKRDELDYDDPGNPVRRRIFATLRRDFGEA